MRKSKIQNSSTSYTTTYYLLLTNNNNNCYYLLLPTTDHLRTSTWYYNYLRTRYWYQPAAAGVRRPLLSAADWNNHSSVSHQITQFTALTSPLKSKFQLQNYTVIHSSRMSQPAKPTLIEALEVCYVICNVRSTINHYTVVTNDQMTFIWCTMLWWTMLLWTMLWC